MKSYNGKIKPDSLDAEKSRNRNSFLNFVSQVDKEIEAWVDHLISEIESLKEKSSKSVEGF